MSGVYTGIGNEDNVIVGMGLNPAPIRAAIYCRLSKDDEQDGISASIQNQRAMLEQYCHSQSFEIVAVYQDDGYTGMNTNRPDYQRMMKAVERKQVDIIVVKDSSRLGRDYIQMGQLMETFFPKHGVHFIALNDGIDTRKGYDEFAPFRHILNQMYSQDISKKIHSAYLTKAQKGDFTGCLAPFGYKKSAENRNRLEPDEDTAWIVQQIYELAKDGRGPNHIRRRLEEMEIPCPAWWNREKGYRNTTTKFERENPDAGRFMWDFTTIKGILSNPVYIGSIASQKQGYRFKTGWIKDKKPAEWLVVEDMHEPLVSLETFDLVQEKVKSRQRTDAFGNYGIFSGLIKCGQCGYALTKRPTHQNVNRYIFSCSRYNKYGKAHCTQHRVDHDTLYDIVLEQIREQARQALADEYGISQQLEKENRQGEDNERIFIERSIADDTARLNTLDRVIAKLYEDMVGAKISSDNFYTVLEKSQDEQKSLRNRIANNMAWLNTQEQEREDSDRWIEIIQEYTDIQELDATILNHLIRQIVVHEYLDSNNILRQTVEIFFNFSNHAEKYRIVRE